MPPFLRTFVTCKGVNLVSFIGQSLAGVSLETGGKWQAYFLEVKTIVVSLSSSIYPALRSLKLLCDENKTHRVQEVVQIFNRFHRLILSNSQSEPQR
jgi:hypothetical protein